MEHLELTIDPTTAAFLQRESAQRGGTVATAAAMLLRRDAVADAASSLTVWYAEHPEFVEDAERERAAALNEST